MFSCAAHVYRNKNGQFSIHDEQDRDTAYDPQCPGLFYVTSVRQLPLSSQQQCHIILKLLIQILGIILCCCDTVFQSSIFFLAASTVS